MPALLLACLAYLSVALPGSTLGLLWPSMRLSFGAPIGALGILLVFGITASVISSAATGRVRMRTGPPVAGGTMLVAVALAVEAFAPSLWVMVIATVLFGVGFGALDTALNAHAARHFGARDINWMHASYGLGATIGPLLVTALLSSELSWRRTYGLMAFVLAALACVLTVSRRGWPDLVSRPNLVSRTAKDEPGPDDATARRKLPAPAALTFAAVETGIESGAGIWGYVFLTAGRGLAPETAGVAVSAYWAMMFAGRVVLGPVAERLGSATCSRYVGPGKHQPDRNTSLAATVSGSGTWTRTKRPAGRSPFAGIVRIRCLGVAIRLLSRPASQPSPPGRQVLPDSSSVQLPLSPRRHLDHGRCQCGFLGPEVRFT